MLNLLINNVWTWHPHYWSNEKQNEKAGGKYALLPTLHTVCHELLGYLADDKFN